MSIKQLNPKTSHFFYILNSVNSIKGLSNNYNLCLIGSNFIPDSRDCTYTTFYESINDGESYFFSMPFDSNDTIEIMYESNINNYDIYYYDDAKIKHYFKFISQSYLNDILDISNLYLYINKKINWSDIDDSTIYPQSGTCMSYSLIYINKNSNSSTGIYSPSQGDLLPSSGILLYCLYVSETDNPITYSIESLHKDNIEFFIKFTNN